jgi:hypothetical protein
MTSKTTPADKGAETTDEPAVAAHALDVADTPEAKLTAALADAQGAFPPIPKSLTAEVRGKDGRPGYSYKYADLADVLAAVRPVLAPRGLAIVQHTRRGPNGWVLFTELKHVGGGKLDSEIDLGKAPSDPQAFGGALSYLRRYELCTLLGLAPEDDRDAQHVPPGATEAPEVPEWARDATKARRVELVGALEPLVGKAATKRIGADAVTALGLLPDVLVSFAVEVAQAAAAHAEAGAQDRAAEAPDEPVDPRTAPEVSLEDALKTKSNEELLEAEANHPRADVREAAAREIERRLPSAQADEDPGPGDEEPASELAPAGTIEVGDLPSDPAKAIAILRGAGCVCDSPLDDTGREDACPIVGHGIPW